MPNNFGELIGIFLELIGLLLPLVVGVSVLVFFWGLAKFISKAGDTKNHEEGKSLIIWGLIGLFVMLSLFGILRLAYGDLGFSDHRTFGVPYLPTSNK